MTIPIRRILLGSQRKKIGSRLLEGDQPAWKHFCFHVRRERTLAPSLEQDSRSIWIANATPSETILLWAPYHDCVSALGLAQSLRSHVREGRRQHGAFTGRRPALQDCEERAIRHAARHGARPDRGVARSHKSH